MGYNITPHYDAYSSIMRQQPYQNFGGNSQASYQTPVVQQKSKSGMPWGTLLLGGGLIAGLVLLSRNGGAGWKAIGNFFKGNKAATNAAQDVAEGAQKAVTRRATSGLQGLQNLSKESIEKTSDAASATLKTQIKELQEAVPKKKGTPTVENIFKGSDNGHLLGNNEVAKKVTECINEPATMNSVAENIAKVLGKEGDTATIASVKKLIEAKYNAIHRKALAELANAADKSAVDTIINGLPEGMQTHIRNGQAKLTKHLLKKFADKQITNQELEWLKKIYGNNVTNNGRNMNSLQIFGKNSSAFKNGSFSIISNNDIIKNYDKYRQGICNGLTKEIFEQNPEYYNSILEENFGKGVSFRVIKDNLFIDGLDKLPEASKNGDFYKSLVTKNLQSKNAVIEAERARSVVGAQLDINELNISQF